MSRRRIILNTIRDRWDIDSPHRVDLDRDISIVSSAGEWRVVRLTTRARAVAIARLLTSAERLAGDGRVPFLVPDKFGNSLVFVGSTLALVACTYLPGRTPIEPTVTEIRDAGSILAELHRCSPGRSGGDSILKGRNLGTWRWNAEMDSVRRDWNFDLIEKSLIGRAAELCRSEMSGYQSLTRVLIHGDVAPGNLVRHSGRVGLFDFGGVIDAPRLLDVQGAIVNLAGRSGVLSDELAGAFLEGYNDVWPLGDDENSLLDYAMIGDLARVYVWLKREGDRQLGLRAADERRFRLLLLRHLLGKFNLKDTS